MRVSLNNQWFFTESYSDALLDEDNRSFLDFTRVRIPHTVRELPFNYCSETDYQMVSGYVCELEIKKEWSGKILQLIFEGAAHQADVYCNGRHICTHKCGYTAFVADITGSARFGEKNRIVVKLDSRESLNIPPFGKVIDYMTYGGIYRPAYLEILEPSHFADVFVRASMDGELLLSLEGVLGQNCTISGSILDHQKKAVAWIEEQPFCKSISMKLEHVNLWCPGHPYLYTLCLSLLKNGEVVDERTVRFGFRTIEFIEKGLFINKKRYKLRGLNRHQSWPYMGYAVPERAQRLDADILKWELGCNAVRTSHYPQSQAFVDRCDEIGLLVFTEIPGWQYIGDDTWKKQVYENVREMIIQYRNHPSIFLWGVRINESQDDDILYRRTNAIAHKLDPSRPTGGVRCIKNSHLFEDVYTYNDFIHNGTNGGCEPKQAVTENKKSGYLIAEYNGHMFPTKSFDCEDHRTEHALRHARVLADVGRQPEIAGSFGWCMFDYNTHKDFGSGDRICYHGVMDMFRNPKLAAAVYASQQDKLPVFEVCSSMDIGEHAAGRLGSITVFTNGDKVRLYKNDEYIGIYSPDERYRGMKHPPVFIEDTVGCLLEKKEGYTKRAAKEIKECLFAVAKYGQSSMPPAVMAKVAWLLAKNRISQARRVELFGKYIGGWGEKQICWKFEAVKGNKVIASLERRPVDCVILEVKADTHCLVDGPTWDVATLRFAAKDRWGNRLPYCNRGIRLRAEGSIALVGPLVTSLSGGMGGCYVKSTGIAGEGRLYIQMEGVEEQIVEFSVEKKL